MKTLTAIIVIIFIGMFVLPTTTQAQEEPQPKRFENVEWKRIMYVKYVPGKMGRALEIIDDHFVKAGQAAGTASPVRYEMRTGEWDLVLVWNMKEGVETMIWEVSPDNIAWRKKLNEQLGGADKAQAVWDEYMSLVAHSHADIAIHRK
jgi:hypothetical protein